MGASIDHLVVAASSLAEGVHWCESTFGVAPGPGGAHALMGTHNRLLKVATPEFPHAYFEIIAVNAQAKPTRPPGTHRWFDLDDATLQADLARNGPRLVHFVAQVPDADAAVKALAADRIDRGRVIDASRDTPAGRLAWRITVRDDGQRLFYGTLPTLIEWGPVHPTDAMTDSGVTLKSLTLTHPRAGDLAAAVSVIGLSNLPVFAGPPNLHAVFDTPRGAVTLDSRGI